MHVYRHTVCTCIGIHMYCGLQEVGSTPETSTHTHTERDARAVRFLSQKWFLQLIHVACRAVRFLSQKWFLQLIHDTCRAVRFLSQKWFLQLIHVACRAVRFLSQKWFIQLIHDTCRAVRFLCVGILYSRNSFVLHTVYMYIHVASSTRTCSYM